MIAVTRELDERWRAAGAAYGLEFAALPTADYLPVAESLPVPPGAWLAITSPRTWRFSGPEWADRKVAAVGKGTAKALESFGIKPDFVGPQPASGKNFAHALVAYLNDTFKDLPAEQRPAIVHPCSALASSEFADLMSDAGYHCLDVAVYRPEPRDVSKELQAFAPTGIIATAPSALTAVAPYVKNNHTPTVVLGEPTRKKAAEFGLPVTVAPKATPQAVAETMAALQRHANLKGQS